MAAITIRNIDEDLKRRLRQRAAELDRSMEEEARVILRRALEPHPARQDIATEVRALVKAHGAADDLVLLEDEMAEPLRFE